MQKKRMHNVIRLFILPSPTAASLIKRGDLAIWPSLGRPRAVQVGEATWQNQSPGVYCHGVSLVGLGPTLKVEDSNRTFFKRKWLKNKNENSAKVLCHTMGVQASCLNRNLNQRGCGCCCCCCCCCCCFFFSFFYVWKTSKNLHFRCADYSFYKSLQAKIGRACHLGLSCYKDFRPPVCLQDGPRLAVSLAHQGLDRPVFVR